MNSLASCTATYSDICLRVGLSLMDDLCARPLHKTIIKQVHDFIREDELEPAIADYFVSRNETALQVNYAKVLVENLLNDWLPIIRHLEKKLLELQDIQYLEIKTSKEGTVVSITERDLSGPEYSFFKENQRELHSLANYFGRYNRSIINRIRQFTPAVYSQYRTRFQEYINLKEPETLLINQEPQPPQPGVKLQWKGDKTDLAELVWALAKSGRIADTSTGQSVTQKELVSQIVNLLGLDSLDIGTLMKGRYGTKTKSTTYKAQDGKNFVNTLQTLLDSRVLD